MSTMPISRTSSPPASPRPQLSNEAKVVLRRRYLVKNANGTVIETAQQQARKATVGLSAGSLNWPGLLRKLDRVDTSYKT